MSKPKAKVLFIYVIGLCIFLSNIANVFAVFQDVKPAKETGKSLSSEREKSSIRLQERQIEESKSQRVKESEIRKKTKELTGVTAVEKKQVSSTMPLTKKTSAPLKTQYVVAVVLLSIIVAVFLGNKFGFIIKRKDD